MNLLPCRKGTRNATKPKILLTTKLNTTILNSTELNAMRKKQLVIHIPSDLKEWLREEAAKDDRSVSYVVEKLLQQGRELIQQKEPAP